MKKKNMRAVHNNRLVRLAKALRDMPAGKFNYFSYFAGNWKEPACGTTACALGLAATLPEFQALGAGYTPRAFGAEFTWRGEATWPLEVTLKLFGLDERQSGIFYPNAAIRNAKRTRVILTSPGKYASAKQVANHILKFVRLRREGVIS